MEGGRRGVTERYADVYAGRGGELWSCRRTRHDGLGASSRALVVASFLRGVVTAAYIRARGRGDVYAGGGAVGRPGRGRHSALAEINSRFIFRPRYTHTWP